jgi:acyl dehydratase
VRTIVVSWDELDVGQPGPTLVDDPLTVTDFVRYQGASGDMNPIHHDTAFAKRAGYPEPFAVGMRQASVLASYVVDWLGPENIRRFKVQFREQAWPGDVITYTGVVTARREVDGERFVDVDLAAARQTGDLHIKGWATFVVPREEG